MSGYATTPIEEAGRQPVVEDLFAARPDAPPPTRQYLYELHDVITR
jgi:hypothetical protein